MRMMSICLTWFLISGLGEPNIYHDLGVFYKNVGILLGDCLTREELMGSYEVDPKSRTVFLMS